MLINGNVQTISACKELRAVNAFHCIRMFLLGVSYAVFLTVVQCVSLDYFLLLVLT